MEVTELDLDEWDAALPDTGFEVFHLAAALDVLRSHTDAELRLFGAFNGHQPVALLPVFVRQSPVGRVVTSPPPSMSVPYSGPILLPNSPKQGKRERINREFTAGILDQLDVAGRGTLFRMVCSPHYGDPRPYGWSDLSLRPRFTYVVDVDSVPLDSIRDAFSRSLRREIRDAEDLGVTVHVDGLDAARKVYEDTSARYAEQDESFPLSWPYVRDLLEALDDRVRVYTARAPDGEYLNGVTVLYSNDKAYFWQGGTLATYENVSVNGLLHWRIISDIADDPPFDPVGTFDLVGANTPRFCEYKAKFNADLVPYYVAESSGPMMDAAKRVYHLIKGGGKIR